MYTSHITPSLPLALQLIWREGKQREGERVRVNKSQRLEADLSLRLCYKAQLWGRGGGEREREEREGLKRQGWVRPQGHCPRGPPPQPRTLYQPTPAGRKIHTQTEGEKGKTDSNGDMRRKDERDSSTGGSQMGKDEEEGKEG